MYKHWNKLQSLGSWVQFRPESIFYVIPFKLFFQKHPLMAQGWFWPWYSPHGHNFQFLTFSMFWLKSNFFLCLPKQTQFIMETPPDTPEGGSDPDFSLTDTNFQFPTFFLILRVKSKFYLPPKQTWFYPRCGWPLAKSYMQSHDHSQWSLKFSRIQ